MTEPSETEPSKTARSEAEPAGAAESSPGPVQLPGLETVEPSPETPDAAAIVAPLEALLLMATEPLPAAGAGAGRPGAGRGGRGRPGRTRPVLRRNQARL